MRYSTLLLVPVFLAFSFPAAFGQGKGVDKQNQKVTDTSRGSAAGNNGTKQDTGTAGSGINWGRDKTKVVPALPNPYRFTARRDALIAAITDVMRDRKLIVDDAASRPTEGIIVTQPYTFIKGAVVTQPELSRYADVQSSNARGWTRGRYTLTVEVQPIDAVSANVSVNAKIEGRTDGPSGAEWITLQSTGTAEQEFLSALVENVTGTGPTPSSTPDLQLTFNGTIVDSGTKKIIVSATPSSVIINAIPKSTRN